MSGRPGILVTVRVPADGGKEPNKYTPEITAEIRIHWPPKANESDIYDALYAAVIDAELAILKERAR